MNSNAKLHFRRATILGALALAALAQFLASPSAGPLPIAGAVELSHDDYAATLKAYVDGEGMVDYKGLKESPQRLRQFLAVVANIGQRQYDAWNENDKIAFWLNAYNAITLDVIIRHYPIQPTFPARLYHPHNSIRQIKGAWTGLKHWVLDKTYTLEQIEHEILRKHFNEPRIHMALVCAAMGCPKLRNEPYVGSRLGQQLDDQARHFVRHNKKFRIDRAARRVYYSPIFKWFGEDFVKTYGTHTALKRFGGTERAILNFLSRYLGPADRQYLLTGSYRTRYLDYDWSLNE